MKKIYNTIVKINEKIAMALTNAMSSMVTVYLFLFIAVIPLAFPSLEVICMYISSTVIQLISLPLLAVGAQLLGKSQERRSIADHAALLDISKEMHILLDSAKKQEDNLVIAIARLEYLESQLVKKSKSK